MTILSPFDEILQDMETSSPAGESTVYDQLNDLLAAHDYPFVRTGDATWKGVPMSRGYDYVEIDVAANEKCVAFSLDTGIRVPADKAREVNKLILLANNRFKLTGFDHLGREGGAVTFSYRLPYSRLGIAAGDVDAWLTAGDEDEDDELDRCLGLATHTVRDYTVKLNAIVFGGASAIEALKIK